MQVSLLAPILRTLRPFSALPGWRRVVNLAVPDNSEKRFIIDNNGDMFDVVLDNFIDRELYFIGNYEDEFIEAFEKLIPHDRKKRILDIGCNIGTHTISFAKKFDSVVSFDPNPRIWEPFERNIALNKLSNVELCKIGLASTSGVVPFYLTAKTNYGLGTISTAEQYDVSLVQTAMVDIERGDDFLMARSLSDVDAIKIDVQGLEFNVLLGLHETLRKNKPFVWVEIGSATHENMNSLDKTKELFPYDIDVYEMIAAGGRFKRRCDLVKVEGKISDAGNFIVVPAAK